MATERRETKGRQAETETITFSYQDYGTFSGGAGAAGAAIQPTSPRAATTRAVQDVKNNTTFSSKTST